MTPPHKTVREFWAVQRTDADSVRLMGDWHGRVKEYDGETHAKTAADFLNGHRTDVVHRAVRVVETLEVKTK